jgi:CRP-like cAMP-binding protein
LKADNNINLIPIEHNKTACSECSVRRLALFHGVPEEDLLWTQDFRSNQFTIAARKEIYRETEPCEYIFTVYHGWVALYKSLDNGKRQILRIALPGDMIGFQPNLQAPMSSSAMSLSETVLCAFPSKSIPDLLRKNINVARRLSELNARDMNICQSRLLTVGQQSALERIAFFCSELFYRTKMIYNHKQDTEIYFPVSQEDIGDATGLTKIHVNRTLKTLREMNLMQISARTLKIHDVDRLCELGNFDPASVHVHVLY